MNGAGFEHWRKLEEKKRPEFLFLTKDFLMQREAQQIDEVQYPEKKRFGHVDVNFHYHFEPGHPRDGVSVVVPLSGASQIKAKDFGWLVPGMIREKVTYLIKNLPKSLRGQCGHLQDAVTEFLSSFHQDADFSEAFTQFIRKKTQSKYRLEDKDTDALPDHLKVNFIILDEEGTAMDEGRNLPDLQQLHKERVVEVLEDIAFGLEQEGITYWPEVETIPHKVEANVDGKIIVGYPALIDRESHVDLIISDHEDDAQLLHQDGIKRLLAIQLHEKIKQVKKSPPRFDQFGIRLQTHIPSDALKSNYVDVIFDEILHTQKEAVNSRQALDQMVTHARKTFTKLSDDLSTALVDIAKQYHELQQATGRLKHLPNSFKEDYAEQLEVLLPPYEQPLFMFDQLRHIPRFIKAMQTRAEKYAAREHQDQEHMREINRLKEKWIEKVVGFVEADESIPHDYVTFQWALQELRVSLFAQELKTSFPISVKRMNQRWADLVD